nr:hypothetical protein G7K_5367-T1 [Ipomoea batatas]
MYVKKHPFIILRDEVDSHTLPSKSPTSSNTVEIGGDEHSGRTRPKFTHDDVPSVLVHVSVSCRNCVITATHFVGEPINLSPAFHQLHPTQTS